MNQQAKMLNLGCGQRFHEDWVNIDFVSTSPLVKAHNLLQGIPHPDYIFDAVYHSHVLEHFERKDGENFLRECYRVLRKGGVLRIAIPDLESIMREYMRLLDEGLQGKDVYADYQWILIELYDQATRNASQGEMGAYLRQDVIPNEDYIYKRTGSETKDLRNAFLAQRRIMKPPLTGFPAFLRRILNPKRFKENLYRLVLGNEYSFYETGRFRLTGEPHLYMYDRYNLRIILQKIGFSDFRVMQASQSQIPNWEKYKFLDLEGDEIRKPDSLFVEAIK